MDQNDYDDFSAKMPSSKTIKKRQGSVGNEKSFIKGKTNHIFHSKLLSFIYEIIKGS